MRTLGILLSLCLLSACGSVPTRDLRPGEIVPLPTPWNRTPPSPPEEVVMSRTEASITVDLMVEGDGSVSDVRVIESTPTGALDESVVAALMDWEYKAPVVDGVRVRRRTEPLTIRLFYHPCPKAAAHDSEFMDICIRFAGE